MSGTSVDGLDVALCKIGNAGFDTEIEILNFETVPYDTDFKKEIKSVFSKQTVDLEKVCLLNPWVATQHAAMILHCLAQWKVNPEEIDLIASHGQTIYHAPKSLHQKEKYPNATLQIGDGDHIACRTNIITISDFRQKHIAAGGEGAPLAVYGDFLIFTHPSENRIMLNIGGIANLTYLPKTRDATQVFSTDVGSGNTLMDAYVQNHFPGLYYDENAAIALRGTVSTPLLKALKQNGFFDKPFPKTTGPELLNLAYLKEAQEKSHTTHLGHEDVMATLNKFSADMIVKALQTCLQNDSDFVIYTSGGGMHNPLLLKNIAEQFPDVKIRHTGDLNINPDAKEALLFAVLANECVAGGNIQFGNQQQGIPSVTMGKISFPT
jgi:anhydro-N-acetylmuramic acid kinase